MTDVTVKRMDFKQAAADASEKYKGSLDMIESGVDYNDGNWHGWNGGECPVHPESLIEIRTTSGYHQTDRKAGITAWANPKLFRVTKPYVEPPKPREFWINVYADAIGSPYSVFEDEQRAMDYAQKGLSQRIHVREVIEE